MIEEKAIELILNYGVLGLWTTTLLYERYRTNKEMKNSNEQLKKTIETNTIALTKVYEIMQRAK
jgi:hypothetical protein